MAWTRAIRPTSSSKIPSIAPMSAVRPPELVDFLDPATPGLLAIDVGNSRTKFGVFRTVLTGSSSAGELPSLVAATAARHDQSLPWGELRSWGLFRNSGQTPSILAGVNPTGIERILREWPADVAPPQVIRDLRQLGLKVTVDFPEKVGIDRLLNGVAANSGRQPGESAVVVDSGTATTVDRVSAEGAFEGGAILPGFELAGLSLHRYTALLPQIVPEELRQNDLDPLPLGKNTREAIRSGIFWGQVGAVRELVRRLVPTGRRLNLLLTGGGAPLLLPHLQDLGTVRLEEHLPLKGLAIVHRTLSNAELK